MTYCVMNNTVYNLLTLVTVYDILYIIIIIILKYIDPVV